MRVMNEMSRSFLREVLDLLKIKDPASYLADRNGDTIISDDDHPDLQTDGDPHLMTGRTSTEEDLVGAEADLQIL